MAVFAGSLRKLLLRWTSDRDFHKNLAVMINRIALSAGQTYKFNLSTRRNSKFLGAFFTHKMPFLDFRIRAHGAVANLSNNTDLHFSFRFHSRTPRLRLVPKPHHFAHLRRLKFLSPIPTVKAWPDVLEKAVRWAFTNCLTLSAMVEHPILVQVSAQRIRFITRKLGVFHHALPFLIRVFFVIRIRTPTVLVPAKCHVKRLALRGEIFHHPSASNRPQAYDLARSSRQLPCEQRCLGECFEQEHRLLVVNRHPKSANGTASNTPPVTGRAA